MKSFTSFASTWSATLLLLALIHGSHAMITENDKTILNFALNLEYLEAEFYSWAAYGRGLPADLTGSDSATIGGKKAQLSPAYQALAQEIADDEIAHVRLLRNVLGASAVAKPVIDIGPAFAAAALASVQLAYNVSELPVDFDPYANDVLFLHGAFIFEDVGVTAYKGAAASIDSKDYLSAAAGIMAVEAYHAGAVRTLLSNMAANTVFPFGITVAQIVQAISELRDSVQEGDTDQGLLYNSYSATMPMPSTRHVADPYGGNMTIEVQDPFYYLEASNVVPTDASGLVFGRGVEEVLKIVYLGSTACGGFFPECINTVPTTSSTAG